MNAPTLQAPPDAPPAAPAAGPRPGAGISACTVLLVDDEPNILTSLKRVLRPCGYNILTANSGPEGLELLQQNAVDVVVSDMRMPGMSGAEFLGKVRILYPDIMRILLTGFSDMSSTIDAINKGAIFRYVAKPWDDREITMIVNQALETKRLLEEKRRLEAQIKLQNEELKELNTGLEAKVKARTAEIEQTMLFVENAHNELKKSYITSVKVFSNLIEMREGGMGGHSRRIAEYVRQIAILMKLPDHEAQDAFLAALLHDIGKIGLPDSMLKKPYAALNQEERDLMHKHPVKGQTALMALESMAQVGLLIRHHHERYDGGGYPDGIAGDAIPLGARILAVVNEYDDLLSGTLQMRKYSTEQAIDEIRGGAGKRYDPEVVKAFVEALGKAKLAARGAEIELRSGNLQPGMILSRDIIARDGVLLLARDRMLDERIILQIRQFEHVDGRQLPIFIHAQKKAPS